MPSTSAQERSLSEANRLRQQPISGSTPALGVPFNQGMEFLQVPKGTRRGNYLELPTHVKFTFPNYESLDVRISTEARKGSAQRVVDGIDGDKILSITHASGETEIELQQRLKTKILDVFGMTKNEKTSIESFNQLTQKGVLYNKSGPQMYKEFLDRVYIVVPEDQVSAAQKAIASITVEEVEPVDWAARWLKQFPSDEARVQALKGKVLGLKINWEYLTKEVYSKVGRYPTQTFNRGTVAHAIDLENRGTGYKNESIKPLKSIDSRLLILKDSPDLKGIKKFLKVLKIVGVCLEVIGPLLDMAGMFDTASTALGKSPRQPYIEKAAQMEKDLEKEVKAYYSESDEVYKVLPVFAVGEQRTEVLRFCRTLEEDYARRLRELVTRRNLAEKWHQEAEAKLEYSEGLVKYGNANALSAMQDFYKLRGSFSRIKWLLTQLIERIDFDRICALNIIASYTGHSGFEYPDPESIPQFRPSSYPR